MSDLGEAVIALHLQGLPTVEVAHRLGVAQSTAHYHLRKLVEGHLLPEQDAQGRVGSPTGPPSEESTRERVAALLGKGLNRAEVARQLGVARSVVSYHARRLGKPIDDRCARRYDWAQVQSFYNRGNSVRDCVREFGFSSATWSDAVRRGVVAPRPTARPIEELFAASTRRHRGHLKQRLLRLGLKTSRCERCGLSEWRGRPLSVALHHINGDRLDNRLENLELLCPNCHSQTDTYAGRNGRRTVYVPTDGSGPD